MSKNLLNYHRYRRKWDRKMEQIKQEFSDEPTSVHRDFAWQTRKQNPYVHTDPHARIKRRIAFSVIMVCAAAIFGLGIFHPFFHVSRVTIEGVERLTSQELEGAVLATMNYKKWYLFPAKSFFLVDVDEVRDVLKSRFPLSMVSVEKVFPHHLQIQIHEKISTIIYDNGKQYSYIGLDGHVVEVLRAVGADEWKHEVRMVTSTMPATTTVEMKEEIVSSEHIIRADHLRKEFGNHPIVYDTRRREGGVNTAMLQPETVRGIVTWYQKFSAFTTLPVAYVQIEHELGDAVVHMNGGWYIRVQLHEHIDDQFDAITLLLDKQKEQKFQYIDVRFPGKVYWQ